MTASSAAVDGWDLDRRRLYLCTPDRPDLEVFVGRCIDGGVDIVQLRDKHLGDAELVRRATAIQQVCTNSGVPFVLNDRPDLAAAMGADGVHVGQDDVSVAAARAVVGDEAIVGLSTHAPHELDAALGGESGHTPARVDYLSAGPVVPTPTKPGRAGTGTAYISEATERSLWPVWVTGGVDPDSITGLVEAGARHFVVVRWLVDADDPEAAARRLRRRIDEALVDTEAYAPLPPGTG